MFFSVLYFHMPRLFLKHIVVVYHLRLNIMIFVKQKCNYTTVVLRI